ncbi:uroporphyrinogen-III synthase [Undibacterium sp. CY7W]|uniref:Uroporphyrinogen-III synthase n=2 Tax=Undibacterium rugosum TaxID=2762291 RepID=A0A923I7L2_9BURK|nr:uroporphyrinogen-III synthase [Undibacterium rugosum]MBR7777435.1 uroporphyrinogen-III synthase [Undibacterium rugosum]
MVAGRPVVITRPVKQGVLFQQRLSQAGLTGVLFPLLEIAELPDKTALLASLARLDSYAMVAFVSPNAIDHYVAHVQSWPKQVDIAVMGAGGVAALQAYGGKLQGVRIISPTNALKTDSETLLEELDLQRLAEKRVLIVRGQSGREFLADALRNHAVLVDQLPAYVRSEPVFDAQRQQQLQELLRQQAIWVITSSEALRTLHSWIGLLDEDIIVANMQRQQIVVPHQRIAETAQQLGFHSITLTGSGDEQLLVALQSQI